MKQVLRNIHLSDVEARPASDPRRLPLVRVVTKGSIGVTYAPSQGYFLQTMKLRGILELVVYFGQFTEKSCVGTDRNPRFVANERQEWFSSQEQRYL